MPPMKTILPCLLALILCLANFAGAEDKPDAPKKSGKPAPVEMTVKVTFPEVEKIAAEAESVDQDKYDSVLTELADMRKSLDQLQQTLDLLVNGIMADLQTENRQLRDEIDTLRTRQTVGALPPPGIPRPGGDNFTQMLADNAGADSAGADTPGADQPFSYDVLDEWGRAPDVAKSLGEGITSLKGMVLVVPPNSSKDDLSNLGLDLRTDYAAYDNINIEVFNSVDAARAYITTQTGSPEHHVLSVSKHATSGRDVILLINGDTTEEIAF